MADQQQCPCCGQPWREKVAPVQGYAPGIPWSIHLEAYAAYSKKWSPQPALIDLEGRGCRGGFGLSELDEFVPGWRDRVSEIHLLRAEVARLKAAAGVTSLPAEPDAAGCCNKNLAKPCEGCPHVVWGTGGVRGAQEPVGNRCGCNHWTTKQCPARNCPWQGRRPVDVGVTPSQPQPLMVAARQVLTDFYADKIGADVDLEGSMVALRKAADAHGVPGKADQVKE